MDMPDAPRAAQPKDLPMTRFASPRFARLIDAVSPVVLVFISLALAGATAVGA